MTPLARVMPGHKPPPEDQDSKEPAFARSCRSAQSGYPAAPREVYVLLLPHGPDRVSKHLPRRTRLRRPAGLEENRPVPYRLFCFQGTRVLYTSRCQLSNLLRPQIPPKTGGWLTPKARLRRNRSGSVEAKLDILLPPLLAGTATPKLEIFADKQGVFLFHFGGNTAALG